MENKRKWFDEEDYPDDMISKEIFFDVLSYWATNRNVIKGLVGILQVEPNLSEELKQERLSEILGAIEMFDSLLLKAKRHMEKQE